MEQMRAEWRVEFGSSTGKKRSGQQGRGTPEGQVGAPVTRGTHTSSCPRETGELRSGRCPGCGTLVLRSVKAASC